MLFERTEHEPEEYDPEEDLHDPDTDSLTIPRVEVPDVESSFEDAPAEVQKPFWLTIVAVKLAVMAGAIGIILLALGYDSAYTVPLLGAGVAFFVLALYRVHVFRSQLEREADRDDVTEGERVDGPASTERRDDSQTLSESGVDESSDSDSTSEPEPETPDADRNQDED